MAVTINFYLHFQSQILGGVLTEQFWRGGLFSSAILGEYSIDILEPTLY